MLFQYSPGDQASESSYTQSKIKAVRHGEVSLAKATIEHNRG